MKTFKDYIDEIAANSVAGSGVDLSPAGKSHLFRRDKRKKYSIERMYKKSLGMKTIENIIKKKKEISN